MAYETQNEPRQVVLNQPPIQRDFVQTESVYVPEPRGFSGIAVAALVIGAVALVTVIFLVMMNNRSNANDNTQLASQTAQPQQQQQPIVVQQPAPQQPIVVQQPAAAQPAPIVVQQPVDTSKASPEVDQWIQSEFERKMMDDDSLAGLSVTADSAAGKVTLKGTVSNDKLKSDIEKMTRSIKGVKNVDNQIIVNAS